MKMNTQSWWKVGKIAVVCAGLLVAPASWAQKAASDDTAAENKTAPPEPAKSAKTTPAALPAKPEPAAAKPSSAPYSGSGSDYPRWEWFMGYSYVNGRVGSGVSSYNANCGSTNIEYNLNHWFGLVADLGGYNVGKIGGANVNADEFSYLFGPRLNYRFGQDSRHTLFGQILVGGSHVNADLFSGTTTVASASNNAFAMTAGGGLDLGLTKHLALRLAQLEYYLTDYDFKNGYRPQNNFRASTGILFRFGGGAPPLPPSAVCSAQPSEVFAGEPVTATASGSNFSAKRTVKYNWSGTGVKVAGNEASTQVDTAGLQPGPYGVTANLSDGGKNGSASCTARFTVKEPRPPVISCSANPASVRTGGTSTIRSTASSPDRRSLTYSYTASGGNISGTGDTATLSTRDARPGRITVNCNVSDDRNLTASATTAVNVEAPPPPPPEIKQLEAKLELHSIYFQTARPTVGNPGGGLVDSQAEILTTLAADFVAYLKYKPDAHLILSGHTDPRGTEEYNQALSQRRVDRTKNFLVQHGVPEDHIETRAFGETQELTADQVKDQMADNPDLSPAEREQMLKNLRVLVLANNRRVDVSLPTGQQSVRRYPFNAKDFLALSSPKSGEEKPPAKKQPKKQ
jgi:outer membrane protein OmpA-like peptidoglycan-associated protein/opacity protein-like surface antigen